MFTPHRYTLLCLALGAAASASPTVLLLYGIAQFQIEDLVGQAQALEAFGFGYGLIALCLIVLTPIQGLVVDSTHWLSRKQWILVASLAGAVSLQGVAYAHTLPGLIIAWILTSFFYGIASAGFSAMVPELIEKGKLSKVSGGIGVLMPLFIVLFSLVILGLLASHPITTKLSCLALLQCAGILPGLLHLPTSTPSTPPNEKGQLPPDLAVSYKQYWLVFASKLCLAFPITGISILPLYYVNRIGLSQSEVFQLNALLGLGVSAMVISGGWAVHWASKHHRQKPMAFMGAFLVAAALTGYGFANSIVEVVICSLLFQTGLGGVLATGTALMNHNLPSSAHLGRDLGILNSTRQIGASVIHFAAPVTIVWGAMFAKTDGYAFYFALLVLFCLLHMAFLSGLKEPDPQRKKGP